jgi:hypothetical protein
MQIHWHDHCELEVSRKPSDNLNELSSIPCAKKMLVLLWILWTRGHVREECPGEFFGMIDLEGQAPRTLGVCTSRNLERQPHTLGARLRGSVAHAAV